MRKIFTLLCVALCATSLFANVVTGTCGDNLQWAYDTDTKALTITGSGYMYWSGERPWSQVAGEITSVSLPDGLTSIGWGAFCYCSSLTSITIPNSVTSIGEYAFDGCTSLTSITIPNSVTSIRYAAFSGCSSLTSITIPYSVTSIGDFAFSGCSSLSSVTIPNSVTSIGDLAFLDCSSLTSPVYNVHCFAYMPTTFKGAYVIPEGIKQIAGGSFYSCYSLTSVTIPNSVTSIGALAFSSCSSLTFVIIPNSVTSIGDFTFEDCYSLTSVTIPNSVTSIGYSAFSGCIFTKDNFVNNSTLDAEKNNYWEARIGDKEIDGLLIKDDTILVACRTHLTSVTIPNSVTSIGDEAFYKCSSLTSVAIPDGVTSIGNSAFYDCSSLTSITIPNSVKSIGSFAFYNCSSLTSVTIGNSVESIGYAAFSSCSSLTSVTIPNSVTSIGSSAFEGCNSLASVTIPNGVRYIEHGTFYECSKLKSIIIPEGVEGIGYEAFYNCSSLTSITIPNSVMVIETGAFARCSSLNSLTIGNSVKYIGEIVFRECSALTSIVWNAEMCTDFDFEYDIDYKTYNAPFYEIRSQITSFVFGDSVQHIPAYLCYGMDNLSSITIPNSVTSIGEDAFWNCTSLAAVTLTANSVEEFCQGRGNGLLYNAGIYRERYIQIDGKDVVEITIPNSITSIGDFAFYGCTSLTSVTIPNSVTSIGNFAFYDCSALESIVWKAKNYTNPTNKEAAPFYDICSQIKSFTFGENVEHIPAYLCYGMDKLTSVTTPNSLKTIGTSAFEGCIRLGKVSLGASMENVAATAFAGCNRLYDVYCYATYPPFVDESSFANYNVYLYVPCENQRNYILDIVWGKFKFIKCIGAESENMGGDSVVINTGSTDVTIIWPTEENADTYSIVIKKDGKVVCTLTFNSEGQLLNIAFAPGREGNHPAQYAEATTNGYRFTVTGLEEGTDYTYTVTSKDAANKTISEHSGEFTTNSATALDNTHSQSANCQKILRNGQLIILRDGVEYNAIGQEL